MTMTYQQAVQQARQLKKQGVQWKKIEEHLQKAGYVSERTGKPIKELAIRYMIDRADRQDRAEIQEEAKEEKMYVVAADNSFKDNFKTLMTAGGFSAEMRLKLLEVLMENSNADVILSAKVDGESKHN